MQKIIFISVLTLFAFAILPDTDAQYFETEMNLIGDVYTITLSLGKSYQASLVVTTGSDLTWMNCEHCDQSYIQTADLFKQSDRSKSYAHLVLGEKLCKYYQAQPNSGKDCTYIYNYPNPKDLTYTVGVLIRESLMLGGSIGVDSFNFVLGCSHITRINLPSNVQGIVGFGGGELSLISQLGEKINHRFSYCLVSTSTKSKLRLGYKPREYSNRRVSTSFELRPPQSFYYIQLDSITVGKKNIHIHQSIRDSVTIDPAVAITFQHSTIYEGLKGYILDELNRKSELDKSGAYDLCFQNTKIKNMRLPKLILGFRGGNVALRDRNVFVDHDGQTCLAILPAPANHISIIGNIAQSDFQVEYDLFNKEISFTPRDCATF